MSLIVFAAVDHLRAALSEGRRRFTEFPARTEQGAWPLTIDVTAASPVMALDTIARAHGALTWRVRYCKPEARPEYATISVRTHDNDGLGFRVWPSLPPDAEGKFGDPCR